MKIVIFCNQHARIYLHCPCHGNCQYILNVMVDLLCDTHLLGVFQTFWLSVCINCVHVNRSETNLIIIWNKQAKIATNFPVCKNKQSSGARAGARVPERQTLSSWFSIKSAESTVLLTRIFVILTSFYFFLSCKPTKLAMPRVINLNNSC